MPGISDKELLHKAIEQNGTMRRALEDIRDLYITPQMGDTQGQTCCRESSRMRRIAQEELKNV